MLSNTIAAELWLACRPAGCTDRSHYSSSVTRNNRDTLPLATHPLPPSSAPGMAQTFLQLHSDLDSLNQPKRQQAGSSLPKWLLLVATLDQEFPVWCKITAHPFTTTICPDCSRQAPNLLINLAKNVLPPHLVPVPVIYCDYMEISPASRLGAFQERKVLTWILERGGS